MRSGKITKKREPSLRRRYDDACAAAHALDLLGDRWSLLVVRELTIGPKRFTDLRAGLPGISANVLTQRLDELEAVGVLVRRKLPPPAPAWVYQLTEWGAESAPIFQALGRWAARSPLHDPSLPFSSASLVLSLRTMFDPTRAAGLTARLGLRLEAETFLADLSPDGIEVSPGPLDGAEAVFAGGARAVAAAIYGGRPLHDLEAEGALAVEGDRALAERCLTLFPLPAKAERPARPR